MKKKHYIPFKMTIEDLKKQGFFVEEHNNGYYWIDLPKAAKRSKYNF